MRKMRDKNYGVSGQRYHQDENEDAVPVQKTFRELEEVEYLEVVLTLFYCELTSGLRVEVEVEVVMVGA